MKALLGKKLGMTQIFTDDDRLVPVTVVEVGPCVITQVKTKKTDGYSAIQIGYEDIEDKKVNKPLKGHFAKANVSPKGKKSQPPQNPHGCHQHQGTGAIQPGPQP